MTAREASTIGSLEEMLPKLRGTIWTAALCCSSLCGVIVYLISRADIATLRSEVRSLTVTQTNHVTMQSPKTREDTIREEMARVRTLREVKGNVRGL